MIPVKKNHKIWIGATFHYSFQYLTITNGIRSAKDLTGFTGTLTILDPQTDATLLTLTSGSGITFGGATGMVDIVIPASTTSAITWTQGKYQLLVVDPSNNETDPLLTGRFSVVGL